MASERNRPGRLRQPSSRHHNEHVAPTGDAIGGLKTHGFASWHATRGTGVTAGLTVAIAPPKVCLALSGGGYRATLFHLGALRRLNELGLLTVLDHVSSVSGGSIIAAHLATAFDPWPETGTGGFRRRMGAEAC